MLPLGQVFKTLGDGCGALDFRPLGGFCMRSPLLRLHFHASPELLRTYGSVLKAQNKQTNELVAIKKMKQKYYSPGILALFLGATRFPIL